MKKLDFVIAGAQKCGTTALWSFLSQHPAIKFGAHKELHFLDDEKQDWDTPSYDRLYRNFATADAGRLWGDATPVYTYWPCCLDHIHKYNPSIKIVIILRGPVRRAYSH